MNGCPARPLPRYQNWYMNYEKSGGALLDLHIHDIDMVRYLFGEPGAVSAVCVHRTSRYDLVNTRFIYEDGPVTNATGDWSNANNFRFKHGYRVNFERATVEFVDGEVTVYNGKGIEKPYLGRIDGITNEIEYYYNIIAKGQKNAVNPPESAALSVRLAERIKESCDRGGAIVETGI